MADSPFLTDAARAAYVAALSGETRVMHSLATAFPTTMNRTRLGTIPATVVGLASSIRPTIAVVSIRSHAIRHGNGEIELQPPAEVLVSIEDAQFAPPRRTARHGSKGWRKHRRMVKAQRRLG